MTAMFDPLPMLDQLKQLNGQMRQPSGSEQSSSCADFKTSIDRSVFCFEGSHGLLKSVFTQQGYKRRFQGLQEVQR